MSLKCIVVDDEPLGRRILEEYIAEIPDLLLTGSFNSALEAQGFTDENKVDLIFLDINMPRVSGIDWMRTNHDNVLVIFTTAYSEYAVEAFEVEAFDFLVKPISFQRFLTAVNRAKKQLAGEKIEKHRDHILVKEGKRLYKIEATKIMYLQAYGDYVRIFAADKTYITKDRMHVFQDQLPQDFIQVHRSYIVNINRVEYIEGNHLMIGGEEIPVSAKFKKEVLKRL